MLSDSYNVWYSFALSKIFLYYSKPQQAVSQVPKNYRNYLIGSPK